MRLEFFPAAASPAARPKCFVQFTVLCRSTQPGEQMYAAGYAFGGCENRDAFVKLTCKDTWPTWQSEEIEVVPPASGQVEYKYVIMNPNAQPKWEEAYGSFGQHRTARVEAGHLTTTYDQWNVVQACSAPKCVPMTTTDTTDSVDGKRKGGAIDAEGSDSRERAHTDEVALDQAEETDKGVAEGGDFDHSDVLAGGGAAEEAAVSVSVGEVSAAAAQEQPQVQDQGVQAGEHTNVLAGGGAAKEEQEEEQEDEEDEDEEEEEEAAVLSVGEGSGAAAQEQPQVQDKAGGFRTGAMDDHEIVDHYNKRTKAEQRLFDRAFELIDQGRADAALDLFIQKWKQAPEEQSLEELREDIWPSEDDDAELVAHHQQWQQKPDKIGNANTTLNDFIISLKRTNVRKLKRHIGYRSDKP
ncbi:unnamed protein product [Vitrella brassicaformis CCMP3155]|uniref:CBM20 domain-containing protein n=2 Tax=Vitrella brassicaformis TaxID=1169539 RepID=A0A0G4FUU0_VITBC|nr:unnamed protein product [Vitrella brassicaformis CCMP3155]|eukprot:CEM18720.1 unnamed protein product [Vitrella brassicaformis CCMP3155]